MNAHSGECNASACLNGNPCCSENVEALKVRFPLSGAPGVTYKSSVSPGSQAATEERQDMNLEQEFHFREPSAQSFLGSGAWLLSLDSIQSIQIPSFL
jgi:hypothetical protein